MIYSIFIFPIYIGTLFSFCQQIFNREVLNNLEFFVVKVRHLNPDLYFLWIGIQVRSFWCGELYVAFSLVLLLLFMCDMCVLNQPRPEENEKPNGLNNKRAAP